MTIIFEYINYEMAVHKVWKLSERNRISNISKTTKALRIFIQSAFFVVAGAGLEPATFGL
jgi:hypothetical protein